MVARLFMIIVVTLGFLICRGPALNFTAAQTKRPTEPSTSKKTPEKKLKERDEIDLSTLGLEVAALRTIHRLQLTAEQLKSLGKMAPDTVQRADKREPGKGSDRVRKRLLDLRDALTDADDERVEELEDKLSALLEEEDADLNDQVKLTASAIRRTPEFIRSLKPWQVVSYLSDSVDDLPEPTDALTDLLDIAADLKDSEWKDLADETINDLKWQLGGIDPDRNRAVGEKIAAYLKKIRGLSDADIEKQRPELEKAAEQLVSLTPPTVLLQHFVEHSVAELLSNPRLVAAVEARRESEPDKKELEKKDPEKK